MKSTLILLLILLCQTKRGSFAKLESKGKEIIETFKENQADMDQQRIIRVHRVADREFPGNDDSDVKSTIKTILTKQIALLGNHELDKLLNDFPNLNNLVQHEAQLYKDLIVVLNELVRDGTITLKNINLAISEIEDVDASSTSVKPELKRDNGLRNLVNVLEDLEGSDYQRVSQSNEKTKNVTQSLDNVLIRMQNHLTFVRRVFERLCRKHHSTRGTLSNVNNTGKLASWNQPKKVSIL
ncbi:PREDICTED: uncharacterized protein LOC108575962 [Habropoda laboriosa]|uniref:uncharacterized protein LOC108575962 n=1 Tax=Habropoda laboriosa TaxID=597456 RepID=UPI00083E06FB|nr:PREDICTED: uncharacterized protein LOC108575962 [Habropoda laboriosa]